MHFRCDGCGRALISRDPYCSTACAKFARQRRKEWEGLFFVGQRVKSRRHGAAGTILEMGHVEPNGQFLVRYDSPVFQFDHHVEYWNTLDPLPAADAADPEEKS